MKQLRVWLLLVATLLTLTACGQNDLNNPILSDTSPTAVPTATPVPVTPNLNPGILDDSQPPQEGMYRYYKAVAESTTKPMILYNVPGRTGANMTAETTLRLAQIDNIIAIKEASSNRGQILEIIQNRPAGFLVLSGNDDETYPLMKEGADGIISVASNIAPESCSALAHAMLEGKVEKAAMYHEKLSPLFRNCFVESNPIPAKAGLAAMGLIANELRLPLVPCQQKTYDLMVETIKELGLL